MKIIQTKSRDFILLENYNEENKFTFYSEIILFLK